MDAINVHTALELLSKIASKFGLAALQAQTLTPSEKIISGTLKQANSNEVMT
jgi:hypothetical protein